MRSLKYYGQRLTNAWFEGHVRRHEPEPGSITLDFSTIFRKIHVKISYVI